MVSVVQTILMRERVTFNPRTHLYHETGLQATCDRISACIPFFYCSSLLTQFHPSLSDSLSPKEYNIAEQIFTFHVIFLYFSKGLHVLLCFSL